MNLKPTLIKLTLWYTLLIMLVSVLLSFVVYRGGARPLERRLELRQPVMGEGRPWPGNFPPRHFDRTAVTEVKRNLALFLLYFNLAVLGLAAVASYSLAKRELRPVEKAMELQGRFTSDAAHELRTPLTAMKSEIEVALRSGALDPAEARELLESNLEEIGRLETLSSSLLRLAQYEGEPGVTAGSVPMGELLSSAAAGASRRAAEKNITVEVSAGEARLSGDRASLLEMLAILLDNSIKYSGEGTVVTVAGRTERRQAVITVSDRGYGIEGDDLERVFDRFFRGKLPAGAEAGGYGLGLSIARRIAEIHRGTVRIRSFPGEGTTVTVKLPLPGERPPPRS